MALTNPRTGATMEVDPISRIEGHLGVKLTTDGSGYVEEADVHGNLWRGFENFLLGRDSNDCITFVQRICGVCPVPHGQVATYAVDNVLGYSDGHITFVTDIASGKGVPAKAVHIRNLVLSAEFLMSHLTHFYHLVALDYVQGPETPPWTPYFADGFYHASLLNPAHRAAPEARTNSLPMADGLNGYEDGFSKSLWDAVVTQYVKALRIRRLTFEAGALFAGRMPMTSCFVGGGVTFDKTENVSTRCAKYKTIMTEVGEFIIKEHVPVVLALGALYPNYDNLTNATTLNNVASALWGLGDQTVSGVAPVAGNTGWGAGTGNFLAWGAFPIPETSSGFVKDTLALPGGVVTKNGTWNLSVPNKAAVASEFLGTGASGVATNLKEHIAHSHYGISVLDANNINTSGVAFPGDVQRTKPNRGTGYSYIKAPRWDGYACEVGPFARMVVAGLYPTNGSLLANNAGLAPFYTQYLKGAGLDPAMVGADLAVALVKEGLATVTVGAATVYGISTAAGVTNPVDPGGTYIGDATVAGVYATSDARITGIINTWIRNIAGGLSVMDRIRGRAIEALYLVQQMIGRYTQASDASASPSTPASWGPGWIDLLSAMGASGETWAGPNSLTAGASGYGASEAPRGALAHFQTINVQGKITAHQAVVPTTWNAAPKDATADHVAGPTGLGRGPMEQAMIGIPFDDKSTTYTGIDGTAGKAAHSGIEALRVAHTFDPCIACAVH